MAMITIDEPQGSEGWNRHRESCWNASDIPAMMGVSPYVSRSDFMRRIATGIAQEHDDQTLARFSEGHRSESLARPLMEKIIGQRVFPVVGYTEEFALSRPLSASFDALVMDDTEGGEHKSLNDEIRRIFANSEPLPDLYTVQMEVQCMVSGARRILFMASKWNGDELVEELHRWYEPSIELRERILQSIRQFEKDLATFVPTEIVDKPKADVVIELPALFIHAQGQITDSNMESFGIALTNKLAEVRAIKLVTDQDFSNAKAAAAMFREQCKKLVLTKEAMLSQTVTIGEASRMMDAWHEDLRQTALQLEKDVEREDLAKKRVMVSDTTTAYNEHIAALEEETKPIRLDISRPIFADAIKRKQSYTAMQSALDDALANGKIAADAAAKDIRAKQSWFFSIDNDPSNVSWMFLFADLQQIIVKPMDDFRLLVTSRIENHKKAEAEKVARIRAEEEAKARAKVAEEERVRNMVAEAAKLPPIPQERVGEIIRGFIADQAKPNVHLIDETDLQLEPTLTHPGPTDYQVIVAVMQGCNVNNETACNLIIRCAEGMKVAA